VTVMMHDSHSLPNPEQHDAREKSIQAAAIRPALQCQRFFFDRAAEVGRNGPINVPERPEACLATASLGNRSGHSSARPVFSREEKAPVVTDT